MTKKETAEQKLLKLIETSAGGGAAVQSKKQAEKKQNLLTVVKFVNQILMVGVALAAFLLANEIFGGIGLINKKINLTVNAGPAKPVVTMGNTVSNMQNLSSYMSSIDRRNLFKPVEREARPASAPGDNRRIAQMTSHLRLVGISWLDQVDTASIMIEDMDKKTTYFLKQGERIGDVSVQSIYADSAVLGYDNEEIMIKYDKSQM